MVNNATTMGPGWGVAVARAIGLIPNRTPRDVVRRVPDPPAAVLALWPRAVRRCRSFDLTHTAARHRSACQPEDLRIEALEPPQDRVRLAPIADPLPPAGRRLLVQPLRRSRRRPVSPLQQKRSHRPATAASTLLRAQGSHSRARRSRKASPRVRHHVSAHCACVAARSRSRR